MLIFHHNDMDGRCAGFWVYHLANSSETERKDCIEVDYKDPFPVEKTGKQEEVYIVDFSIPPDLMREVLAITENVTWIDHHISAIEKYQDFEHELRGVRVDGVAACELTHVYLTQMTKNGQGPIKDFNWDMLGKVPIFTKFIGDRDVWKWEFGDRTQYFHNGLQTYDTNPKSQLWINLYGEHLENKRDYVNSIIHEGVAIEKLQRNRHKELVKSFAHEVKLDGYKGLAVNIGRESSKLFDSVKENYDFFTTYIYDGKQYTVSLYSKNINVYEIAVKYGGGGHRKAAGFTNKKLPFEFPQTAL